MASGGEEKKKAKDLYAVLGLNKECTASELRDAYKKLALVRIPTIFSCFSPFELNGLF